MKTIELRSLGDVDPVLLEDLGPKLQETFEVPVRIGSNRIPIDRFYDRQRGQYNSTEILRYLDDSGHSTHRKWSPRMDDGVRFVGITGQDLFIPILTYVFGEAMLGGAVAVVSYHRFRNELYGLPSDQRLLQERLQKVAIHELGHSLGLVHCPLQYCVMYAASYVEDLDLKGHTFCPFCRSAIKKPRHH